jgi:ribosome assembly protein YihI (activator of Der GTPase)
MDSKQITRSRKEHNMNTPRTARTPSYTQLANMENDELIAAVRETQSALRIAFAQRRWVCDTSDRLDALVAEGDRRRIL